MATKRKNNTLSKTRFFAQAPDILEVIDKYHKQLMFARSIPSNLEALAPADPLVKYVFDQLKLYGVTERDAIVQAKQYAQGHYEALWHEAHRDAAILSVIAVNENQFSNEPREYSQNGSGSLPGMVELPMPKKNLSNPLECRLKQFMDILEDDEELTLAFMEKFEMASYQFNAAGEAQELNGEGFQPK